MEVACLFLAKEFTSKRSLAVVLVDSGIRKGSHEVETCTKREDNSEANDTHDWVGL
jgi:hypothetical protein